MSSEANHPAEEHSDALAALSSSPGAGNTESPAAAGPAAAPMAAGSEAVEAASEAVADEPEVDDTPQVPVEYSYEGHAEPLELIDEPEGAELDKHWYILKVAVNREDSIKDALLRRVRIAGMEPFFSEVIVPTEDVAEFNKAGKRRIVKKKLYPGYLLVNMALTDESWFVVRETPGIGDFTGRSGKPSPMATADVEKILRVVKPDEESAGVVRTAIPFKTGDRVRVKEGYFQNFEGEVSTIDQAHGRVTVMINIFGRPNPVELDHWQIEAV
ncbi:MAG: transcription termination/antitermination protein NusG [Planctomycetota bacterium]